MFLLFISLCLLCWFYLPPTRADAWSLASDLGSATSSFFSLIFLVDFDQSDCLPVLWKIAKMAKMAKMASLKMLYLFFLSFFQSGLKSKKMRSAAVVASEVASFPLAEQPEAESPSLLASGWRKRGIKRAMVCVGGFIWIYGFWVGFFWVLQGI